jgi:hypothetical protein
MTTDYASHAIESTPTFGNIGSKCNTNTLDQGAHQYFTSVVIEKAAPFYSGHAQVILEGQSKVAEQTRV